MKRINYISWKEYFRQIALLSARRSKDPCTQVGCVIVNKNNVIIGTGYNGFPNGCSDDEFSWNKDKRLDDNKYLYVCHAEVNAILNSNGKTDGCILYTTLFPCNECAKIIIQAGIKKIYYISKKKGVNKASKKMFKAAGIKYKRLKREYHD